MNITRLLSEAYIRMLTEDAGMEDAASHVHKEWVRRNEKQAKSSGLDVDYEKLPENEKEKDRSHIRTIGALLGQYPRGKDESEQDHHHRIASMFGQMEHDNWRKTLPDSEKFDQKGELKPRMREKFGVMVDVNRDWKDLEEPAQRENYQAGHAAIAAHVKHMS